MKKVILFLLFILIILTAFLGFGHFYKSSVSTSSTSGENDNIDGVVEVAPKEDTHITMSVIGDIMCHNTQYNDAYVSATNSYDFSYVFEDVKQYISSADIAVGNLETTFAGKARGYSSYPTFNTPEELATNLKDFGIDVVSTANNHCMDKRYSGLVNTLKVLDDVGIAHTGTYSSKEAQDTILVKDVNGIKIAFLSFTYGTNGIPIASENSYSVNLIDEDLILEQIKLAKALEPDLICASMHWGVEDVSKQNSTQENLADLLFKNGVDVILGCHPHVLQPMEKRTITLEDGTTKDVFVIFSLGNFMSGQTKANNKNSIILNLSFTKNGETGKTTIDSASYVPIHMYKASTGTVHRYLVMDVEKNIKSFEAGTNKLINQSTYSNLKTILSNIKKTMGDFIEF